MNLREPKRKKRLKLREQRPLPIVLGNKNEWATYTAHLTDVGSCIIDPNEIVAVHSMGYFGKGSLSRGFPSFGKARYGAPPIIRNRQWIRREEWLKQFNELSMEAENKQINLEDDKSDGSYSENLDEDNYANDESTPDLIEVDENVVSLDSENKTLWTHKEIELKQSNSTSSKEDDTIITINKFNKESLNYRNTNQKECMELSEEESCVTDFHPAEDNMYFVNSNTIIENKLLVLPDSDSETENYLKKVKPKIVCETFPVQETLHLSFEETFFLLYGLGCLNLIDFAGNLLDIDSAWHFFCKSDKNFIPKYVVYHYFRSKGWVVKYGLKYGGDFLLYKQGPPYYHASYIVIIDVLDSDTLLRDESKCMHKFTWNSLFGLERLSETAAKEVLVAQVLWPSSVPKASDSLNLDILSEFLVKELLWRRWNIKHTKDTEEEEDDSC